MSSKDKKFQFTALINIAGKNPYVDVPVDIAEIVEEKQARLRLRLAKSLSQGQKQSKPGKQGLTSKDAEQLYAIGRLSKDGWFRTTFVPTMEGPSRLYLDRWMREEATVKVGDRVIIWLEIDEGTREIPMPTAFAEAIGSNPKALKAWEALTPSRRREVLTYLNFLKTPEALNRNIEKTIKKLTTQK